MKKSFEFVPYKKIGDLIFGMPRKKAKELCGEVKSSCMYGYPIEDRFLDNFGSLHILCNNKELLEAVELFPDIAFEEMSLIFNGIEIFLSKDSKNLISQVKKITDDLIEDEDKEGYSSKKLGLKIYCPDGIVEDVLVHDMYCYEEEKEYIKSQNL